VLRPSVSGLGCGARVVRLRVAGGAGWECRGGWRVGGVTAVGNGAAASPDRNAPVVEGGALRAQDRAREDDKMAGYGS